MLNRRIAPEMLQGFFWLCMSDIVCMCVCVFVCVSSKTVSPLHLKVLHDTLGSQRCSSGAQGIAPVSWWWHQSRRRGGCFGGLVVASLEEALGVSHFLIACIQATSLQGAQGVLWWVAMSLRARCFFLPLHSHCLHLTHKLIHTNMFNTGTRYIVLY